MNENAVSGDRPDTVLLVESEVLARLAISEYLRHCGYRVIEAASAKEDLTLLAEVYIAVDVVFSAVELGGGADGFAVTTEMVVFEWLGTPRFTFSKGNCAR
jgi:CheY-like chemotaxis protein